MKKYRPSLTKKELGTLAHILRQFSDYMAGDDRPDHGLNNLYGYRNFPKEEKWEVYALMGKINRLWYRSWKDYVSPLVIEDDNISDNPDVQRGEDAGESN